MTQQTNQREEGWANDITKNGRTHYYKDGISLCRKAIVKDYFKHFDKDRKGDVHFKDCSMCVKLKKTNY